MKWEHVGSETGRSETSALDTAWTVTILRAMTRDETGWLYLTVVEVGGVTTTSTAFVPIVRVYGACDVCAITGAKLCPHR